MKLFRILPPVLLAVLGITSVVPAEEIVPDPEALTFSSRFRTAVLAQNTRQIMRLTHPHSQECISADERDYQYGLILQDLLRVLGERQTIEDVSIRKVDPGELRRSSTPGGTAAVNWPVFPEEQIIITYTKDGLENTASLYIARDRDEWKWVHACAD
ncbi:MAG: hypothetical protein RBR09_05430 [Desulfobulbaceae bacterium]|jgi:hypothetical protein|nr:hypothetical protein [Desulfobulbaceae bacterium]MDY0350679.1 hypothetical protein [Desulfobulbaceae bacterium]